VGKTPTQKSSAVESEKPQINSVSKSTPKPIELSSVVKNSANKETTKISSNKTNALKDI
jgi:hypothetical protein